MHREPGGAAGNKKTPAEQFECSLRFCAPADGGNRTPNSSLGSWRFTTKLHPREDIIPRRGRDVKSGPKVFLPPRPIFCRAIFRRADPTCSAGKGDPSPHPAGPEKQEIRTETGPDRFLRVKGLEPSRSCPHKNLNLARLPIPPHPRVSVRRTVAPLANGDIIACAGENVKGFLKIFRAAGRAVPGDKKSARRRCARRKDFVLHPFCTLTLLSLAR